MKLIVLGSSSTANGYVLTNGRESLIVECGCKLMQVKRALDFNLSTIVGALASHSHDDHAKYITDYLGAGVPVYSAPETFGAKGVAHRLAMNLEAAKGYNVGEYRVMPFELAHDVPCFGFVIDHPDMGRLVFLTDTYLCEFTFPKVNHWLVEANYSKEILDRNIQQGTVSPAMRRRLLFSHMDIDTTKGMLLANDLTQTRNIVLLHLSAGNSHAANFKETVQAATGVPTTVADKGLIIELNAII